MTYTDVRRERARKLILKRHLKSDIRHMEKFLSDKTSVNNYVKSKIADYKELDAITDTYNNLYMKYDELDAHMTYFASGLQSLGLNKGEFVGIFTENNGRWCACEQGVMRSGAIAVLRGSNAPLGELDYIMTHSGSVGLVLRDERLFDNLKPYLNKYNFKFIVIMFKSEKDTCEYENYPVYSYDEIIEKGKNHEFFEPEQNLDEPCLMLYTSGTTGNPKGVLLTHKNLVSQFYPVGLGFKSKPGENTLQILPVWHAYEHIVQLYYLSSGCHLHFTTLAGLKNDLTRYNVDTLMSVPRIWEALRLGIFQKLKQTSPLIYSLFDFAVKLSITYKIHKMYSERRITNKKSGYHFCSNLYHIAARAFLKPFHIFFTNTLYKKIKNSAGINFRASISGGGALSMKDQLFYDAIGVNLREGYGLTETSPVLTLRYVDQPNYLGCCGKPLNATEVKILDIETGNELGIFQKGVVHVKGYQVMNGYYKDEEATKKVLSDDGWFNTGDIGWLTADNNLVLVGRMKETIVLSNGENVEPVPIEEACLESPYIDQIMLVGQDQSSIGALVVPSEEALKKCGILAKDIKSGANLSIKNHTLHELIKKEIETHIKSKKNLKSFEKIKQFEVIKDNFSMENGLMSQTAKMKRNNIFEKYKSIISNMFSKN